MGFFSRRSKSVRQESTTDQKEPEIRPQSSHGKAQAKQAMIAKSRSVPSSRRTSFSSRDPGFTSHPAYAQTDIIQSSEQSYLPVPLIPSEMQTGRASAGKAARVLGVNSRSIKSAPGSPRLSPQSYTGSEPDKQSNSRHDSVNSHIDAPRIGKLNSEAQMSFSEELLMEPAFSDETDMESKRRSISSIGPRHSRDISHDSFRPTNTRRHTMHQAPQGFSLSRQSSQREMPRGRSHQAVPTYAAPTNASRSYVQADFERHASRRSDVSSIMAPFAGAYQPRASSVTREYATSSPTVRPHRHTMYAEDAGSIRSYTQPPPLTRHASHRQPSASPPALSILDGLKVNRRGKILDEEGETIGELVDGDIIDCVRQKANAYGEVVDEYGRVVGRVQTLANGMGVSSPSVHVPTPAMMADRGVDYFSLHQSSPMLAPALDAQAMQRRMQEDGQQKYRMLMDIPPVPAMPAYYNETTHSPALTAKRHVLATFDQFDGVHCVELPAGRQSESSDRSDTDVPVFDLSEPFMPKAKRTKTPPLVEAPHKASPEVRSPTRPKRGSVSSKHSKPEVRQISAPSPTPEVSSAESSVSSGASSVSVPSSHASGSSVASVEEDEETDHFEDAETHARPTEAKQPVDQTGPIGQAIEQPAPAPRPAPVEQKQARPIRHGLPLHPRVIVPVSQLTQQTITEDAAESPITRPITAERVQPEPVRAGLSSRAKTAPSPATSSIPAMPQVPRSESMPEPAMRAPASAPTSGYNSAEESLSEAESIENPVHQRKEVRISNLPPTTIPNRGLTRSMSDGTGLSRITAMPSVPESAPLPDTPRKSALLSPADAAAPRPGMRSIGARSSAPLPPFPRQNFSGLPTSPFAAANAANNGGKGMQKRNSLPNRPGFPPPAARSAMMRNNKLSPNAPLVSSPLSDHRKTMSSMKNSPVSSEESTPFGSDSGSVKLKSDAVSIISTMSGGGGRRTYFTHAGRVTVDAGDLPPSAQPKKEEIIVAVTERPETAGSKTESIKKRRFSLKIGRKKTTA